MENIFEQYQYHKYTKHFKTHDVPNKTKKFNLTSPHRNEKYCKT